MKKRGFTLIELLVVIAIVGILVAVGISSYLTASKQSRDAKRKTDLEQIRQALETYKSQNYVYPAASGSLPVGLTPDYITSLPQDPQSTTSYYYATSGGGTAYALCATLEIIPSNPSVTGCTTGNNYKVTNP